MNSELALNEIKEILEKYNVSILGVVNPLDYFQIQKAFLDGYSQYLVNNIIVKDNENN